MAENHLEYGYLEGESIGELFTEDPVSMGYYCAGGGQKAGLTRLICLLVCYMSTRCNKPSSSR